MRKKKTPDYKGQYENRIKSLQVESSYPKDDIILEENISLKIYGDDLLIHFPVMNPTFNELSTKEYYLTNAFDNTEEEKASYKTKNKNVNVTNRKKREHDYIENQTSRTKQFDPGDGSVGANSHNKFKIDHKHIPENTTNDEKSEILMETSSKPISNDDDDGYKEVYSPMGDNSGLVTGEMMKDVQTFQAEDPQPKETLQHHLLVLPRSYLVN